jgi:FlaA1/EpsC-like NDP-sugar epimerase
MITTNPGLIDYLRSSSRVQLSFNKRTLPLRYLFFFDGAVIFAAFAFSYLLRFNFESSQLLLGLALKQSLLVLVVYGLFEIIIRSFGGLSNSTRIKDILGVFISSTCSIAALFFITSIAESPGWLQDLITIPRSILLIHYISVLILLSLIRMLFRAKA